MNRLQIKILVALLAMAIVPLSNAQFYEEWSPNKNSRNILTDYASFKSDKEGHIDFELYYKVYNSQLKFVEVDNLFVSSFDITIDVIGKNSKKVATDKISKTIRVRTKSKSLSNRDFRVYQSKFTLPPEKYDFKIELKHPKSKKSRKSNKSKKEKITVKLREFKNKRPVFSSIEFVHAVITTEDSSSKFNKGNYNIIPSVNRRFGGKEANNSVTFYFEINQGEQIYEEVLLISKIRHARNANMSYRDSMTISLIDHPIKAEVRTISIDGYAPGEYTLELELRDKRNKKIAKKKSYFYIEPSPTSFLEYDYKNVMKMLAIIAEPGEIKAIKDIKELSKRIEAFNEFWLKRDPTGTTVENEIKREFYQRVKYANDKFRYLRKEGWKSDRGHVYLKFGSPDQLNDFPYSHDTHPYQEWHYYLSGQYRKFVFVDENEDGNYRLIYPYDGLNMRPDF